MPTAQEVHERWTKSKRSTQRFREQAALNRQFVRNNKQWVYYDDVTRRVVEWDADPSRMRVTMNRVGPDSRRVIAKLMRRTLAFEVPPTSPDDAAMRASRIAESVLATVHLQQAWETKRRDHLWTTWEGAVGALVLEWDSEAGEPVGMDEKGKPVATGDVCIKVASIHEIGTVPGTHDIEKARWWIHAQAVPPEEVKERYGLKKEPAADSHAVDDITSVERQDLVSTPMTMVLTHYERPGKWGKGGVTVVVGNDVVEEEEWPFPFDDHLNLYVAKAVPLHNTWLATTPVSDAILAQMAYNASWSNILEHQKLAGSAKLLYQAGSFDDVEEITDQPGIGMEYNNVGAPPAYLTPPSMPDWWSRLPNELENQIGNTLNIADVSRGDSPPGIEAGVAIATLLEADDTPHGEFAVECGNTWARLASDVLKCYEAYVTETRQATIATPGTNIPAMVQWRGADLVGQTTVRVPADAVVPRNRAAMASLALQLFQFGIITEPKKVLGIAELPDQGALMAVIDPDTLRAERENHWMATGTPRLVDLIDVDENHLQIHKDFMRSDRFENLSPQFQRFFVDHIAAHEQSAAEKAAKQMVAAQAGGAPAALMPTAESKPLDPVLVAQAAKEQEAAQMAAAQAGQMPDMQEAPNVR
jgi:hypothetical protein